MRRLLLVLAASLFGAPALALQPEPGDAALRAGADFARHRAQADLASAYAAQQQAQTALVLRKLELARAYPPGFAPEAEAALARDRMVVDEAGRRAEEARLRSLEAEAKIREIDAWLNARRR